MLAGESRIRQLSNGITAEEHRLQLPGNGWYHAQVQLAKIGSWWHWAVSYANNTSGSGSIVSEKWGQRAATKKQALKNAIGKLQKITASIKEHEIIITWCKTLSHANPKSQQQNLF